jgi:hypothetical protein
MAGVAGHVFVFNMWSEDMAIFSVNGKNLGPIPGADKAPYVPSQVPVPRVLNESDNFGAFANKGTNEIAIKWLGDPIHNSMKIGVPLIQDLLLYVFPFGYYLVNVAGEIKGQASFTTNGVAAGVAVHFDR